MVERYDLCDRGFDNYYIGKCPNGDWRGEMSDLIETLRLACDDPMWADHVEMPKKLLRHAVDYLDALKKQVEELMKALNRKVDEKCAAVQARTRAEAEVTALRKALIEARAVVDAVAGASQPVENAPSHRGREGRQVAEVGQLARCADFDGPGLFPPGPADLDRWRGVLAHSPDLEPAVRRMADGVAARVDLSGPHAARIERLRMLGNGVVSLEGAYAFRTLADRLAGRGSAGAARLVRMMEAG